MAKVSPIAVECRLCHWIFYSPFGLASGTSGIVFKDIRIVCPNCQKDIPFEGVIEGGRFYEASSALIDILSKSNNPWLTAARMRSELLEAKQNSKFPNLEEEKWEWLKSIADKSGEDRWKTLDRLLMILTLIVAVCAWRFPVLGSSAAIPTASDVLNEYNKAIRKSNNSVGQNFGIETKKHGGNALPSIPRHNRQKKNHRRHRQK